MNQIDPDTLAKLALFLALAAIPLIMLLLTYYRIRDIRDHLEKSTQHLETIAKTLTQTTTHDDHPD